MLWHKSRLALPVPVEPVELVVLLLDLVPLLQLA
jgi:hypothetical protein